MKEFPGKEVGRLIGELEKGEKPVETKKGALSWEEKISVSGYTHSFEVVTDVIMGLDHQSGPSPS